MELLIILSLFVVTCVASMSRAYQSPELAPVRISDR
jgi:hypothetical protein